MGSHIFADQVPAEDAVPVRRLRDAGAILIGKTTTPEFGHKPLTDSPLFGVTRNPWDLSRTAGGSSGGAAAAVASGQGPLALGTDGGGSIRIPAACCGIVGLKPTLGRVPHVHQAGPVLDDVVHRADDADGRGSRRLSRRDRRLRTPAIRGRAPGARRRSARGRGPRTCSIGWLPRVGNRLVDAETLAACEAAVRHLEGQGARVETVEENFAAFEPIFLVVPAGRARRAHRGADGRVRGPRGASLRESVERGAAWSATDWVNALAQRTVVYRRVQALFARFDFLVSPTLSRPALDADHDAFEPISIDGEVAGSIRGAWYPYTWPFNLSGHPARVAAVWLVVGRVADRPADRRAVVRRPSRAGARRAPRARAPVSRARCRCEPTSPEDAMPL